MPTLGGTNNVQDKMSKDVQSSQPSSAIFAAGDSMQGLVFLAICRCATTRGGGGGGGEVWYGPSYPDPV